MPDTQTSTVGFVGLGRMGAPIAANIQANGHRLVVWNRDTAKARRFADSVPCTIAPDVASLAASSDIVISMVADGAALTEIFTDDARALAALTGRCLVDMSTIGPAFAVEFATRLRAHGVRFVECPVTGSTAAAASATVTLLVGAEPDDFAAVEPILRPLCRTVRHLGAVGQASLMKLAINSMVLGVNQGVSEALMLAERGGIDRAAAYDAFLGSAAASPVMQYRSTLHEGIRPEDVSFTIEMAEKDLRLITELARAQGLVLPQAEANRSAARDAVAAGHGQADVTAIAGHAQGVADQPRS